MTVMFLHHISPWKNNKNEKIVTLSAANESRTVILKKTFILMKSTQWLRTELLIVNISRQQIAHIKIWIEFF